MVASTLHPISKPLWRCFLTVLLALNACDFAFAQPSDEQIRTGDSGMKVEQPSGESMSLEQLQKLRKSARTPAEKVAVTDAWLKAHPQAGPARMASQSSFSARMTELSSRTAPAKPTEEKASLKWEVRQGLNETLAEARSPKEAVAITDQFLKLNAIALKELAPIIPTPAERRARLSDILANQPSKGGELTLKKEISAGLLATRVSARTPAETVALIDQFLKINADAIAEAYPSKLKQTATAR